MEICSVFVNVLCFWVAKKTEDSVYFANSIRHLHLQPFSSFPFDFFRSKIARSNVH